MSGRPRALFRFKLRSHLACSPELTSMFRGHPRIPPLQPHLWRSVYGLVSTEAGFETCQLFHADDAASAPTWRKMFGRR